MINNYDNITVDELLENLPIYKELIHHINALDPSIIVKVACAYLRVSTDMQIEFSPEAQLEDIIKYCIQENIMLPKENIFLEAGISGTRADKRPEFQRMISKAKEKPKPFDIALVHKFDRFARSREDSVVYKSLLRKKLNIDVIAVKEKLPEDRKLAMMVESNLEMYGEFYSMNLSDEVKKGLRKKAKRGEHGTRPPFGYDKVIVGVRRDKNGEKILRKLVINETEAEIVKSIFEDFANGISMMDISLKLNELGIKTKNHQKFSTRAIAWILHNPIYIGFNRWTENGMNRDWNNPDTISLENEDIPKIIEKELWDKVQNRFEKGSKIYGKKTKTKPKNPHWLRGLIKCDSCGEMLVKNGKTFQCTGYTHGRCNVSHSITVKAVEEAIIEQLKVDYLNKPINIEINRQKVDNKREIDILYNQLKQLEAKEERVKIAYENGIDTLEEYKENKERLKNEKDNLNKKLSSMDIEKDKDEIRNEIFKKCKDAYEMVSDPTVDIEDKTLIVHSLFDKIIFKKSEHKLIIFYK